MPFTALGLSPKITKAVREAGYTEPTPIQTRAIPIILKGGDLIGIAQTGTGKTAAFVLPILERLTKPLARRVIRALVVAPTRELAVQIEENARRYAAHLHLRMATIYGGVGEQPQIAALRSGVDIVIATPGRLLDLMGQRHVDFSNVEVAVLDEADRMLDMGFLPQIRKVVQALPKDRQTLLFSATLSKEIEALTSEFQKNPEIAQIGKRANPAETVEQFVYEIPKAHKLALLQHLLKDASLDSVLVFSRTKHGADKIARRLAAGGVATATLHSNRSQSQRLAALRGFKTGQVRVLVATDIAARGIDVEGISHVINFDFPPQPEDYVHRIGRTGRAKAVGDAISFVTSEDYANLRALERFIGRGIPRKTADGLDTRDIEVFIPDERGLRQPRNQQRSAQPRSNSAASSYSSSRPSASRGESASRSTPTGAPRAEAPRSHPRDSRRDEPRSRTSSSFGSGAPRRSSEVRPGSPSGSSRPAAGRPSSSPRPSVGGRRRP